MTVWQYKVYSSSPAVGRAVLLTGLINPWPGFALFRTPGSWRRDPAGPLILLGRLWVSRLAGAGLGPDRLYCAPKSTWGFGSELSFCQSPLVPASCRRERRPEPISRRHTNRGTRRRGWHDITHSRPPERMQRGSRSNLMRKCTIAVLKVRRVNFYLLRPSAVQRLNISLLYQMKRRWFRTLPERLEFSGGGERIYVSALLLIHNCKKTSSISVTCHKPRCYFDACLFSAEMLLTTAGKSQYLINFLIFSSETSWKTLLWSTKMQGWTFKHQQVEDDSTRVNVGNFSTRDATFKGEINGVFIQIQCNFFPPSPDVRRVLYFKTSSLLQKNLLQDIQTDGKCK